MSVLVLALLAVILAVTVCIWIICSIAYGDSKPNGNTHE